MSVADGFGMLAVGMIAIFIATIIAYYILIGMMMNKDVKQKWLVRVWRKGEMELKKEFTIFISEKRMEQFVIPKEYRATYEITNT